MYSNGKRARNSCNFLKNGEEISGLETLTAYPNPTNAVTTISFTTPEPDEVCLSVYAIDGREVAVLFKGSTEADVAIQVVFDTQDLPAGTIMRCYAEVQAHPNIFQS